MKDTMRPYRKAIYDVLNGNVIYHSVPVNIYDEKVFTGDAPDIYILMGNQRETDITEADCAWTTLSSIDIMIIAKSGSEVSKDVVDDISNEILELLLNLPGGNNLGVQSGFQIMMLKRDISVSGFFQITPTQSEIQKIITMTATIIQ
jgi:hypothetical protein